MIKLNKNVVVFNVLSKAVLFHPTSLKLAEKKNTQMVPEDL